MCVFLENDKTDLHQIFLQGLGENTCLLELALKSNAHGFLCHNSSMHNGSGNVPTIRHGFLLNKRLLLSLVASQPLPMLQLERKSYLLRVRCFISTSVYEKASVGPKYHLTICVLEKTQVINHRLEKEFNVTKGLFFTLKVSNSKLINTKYNT